MSEPRSPAGRELELLFEALRPKLHRYCARMTGSAVDGEDVVQEALANASQAWAPAGAVSNPEGWLFRIAHNAALDFLRRPARRQTPHAPEILDMFPARANLVKDREIVAASLRTFMRLPAAQRSAVILKDVLGHSLEEISELTGDGITMVKSALQRGRARLRELAREPEDAPEPGLNELDLARLAQYVDRFNAHDFDAVRLMLADEVQLELVNRLSARGRDKVGEYFHRYAICDQWRFSAGLVDGRPAMLVFDRHDEAAAGPAYFVDLEFAGEHVVQIRDFLFARYALEGVDLRELDSPH